MNTVSNDGSSEQVACRIVLEGLPNTRDLGDLAFAVNQQILPRKLIRSGALAEASNADLQILIEDYDVQTIIDLRTQEERENNPDPIERMPTAQYVVAPILGFAATGVTRENGIEGIAKALSVMERDPKELMCSLYSVMLLEETGVKGFSRFFEVLINNDKGAVLWHCSAGKDRVGLATTLLLTVLGASWQVILSDYLVTNQFVSKRTDYLKRMIPAQFLTEGIERGLQVVNSVDEAFLDAGIKAVQKEYGSLDAYIKEALGVNEEAKQILRNKYLMRV